MRPWAKATRELLFSNLPPEIVVLYLRRRLFDWEGHGRDDDYPSAPSLKGYSNEQTVRRNLERAAEWGVMRHEERRGQAPITECLEPWNEQKSAQGTPCTDARSDEPDEDPLTPCTDARTTPCTDARRHREQRVRQQGYRSADEVMRNARGYNRGPGPDGWVPKLGTIEVGELCWFKRAVCRECHVRWGDHPHVCAEVNARRVPLGLPPLPVAPAPVPAPAPHHDPPGAQGTAPEQADPPSPIPDPER